MLKKFLSVILLFVLIFNSIGIFIVFEIEKAYIRREIKRRIKEGIPEDELHFFSFTLEEYENLQWTRRNKEFRLNDDMYDIVHSKNAGDSIHLYCVNDKEESILFASLEDMIHKKLEQETKLPNSPIHKIFKLSKLVYSIENSGKNLTFIPDLNLMAFPELNLFYSSPYLDYFSPPPNTV